MINETEQKNVNTNRVGDKCEPSRRDKCKSNSRQYPEKRHA